MHDAVVTADSDGNMIAYGNIRSYDDPLNSGYNVLQMSLYKLDAESLSMTEKKMKTDKVRFRVPANFARSRDAKGRTTLPFFMMMDIQETVIGGQEFQDSQDDIYTIYRTQMFYLDW